MRVACGFEKIVFFGNLRRRTTVEGQNLEFLLAYFEKVRNDKNNEVVRSRRAVRWTLRWFSTT